jgi:hypothetical protein
MSLNFQNKQVGIQAIPNREPLLQIVVYTKGFGFLCVRFVESFTGVRPFVKKISQRSYV